jgi:HD-GYP domain-containing protein (c-di-GMP phosphodiesterase class II)
MPVVFCNKALGAISVFSGKPHYFSKEEIRILDIFASQVAVAIQETKYYEDIHKNYFETIHALVLALEARDVYTRGHTERVTRYSTEVARFLHMPKEELEILRYAGEVHDVGKISIPDFILNKPGRLTPAERAIIELHPVKGAEMLEPLEFLKSALPIVRHHHERYDGTGYPDGLERDKIPVMARILACADAFDAMTSDRPYRSRKLTVEEALAEIKINSGSQFDPHIANLFVKTLNTQHSLKALQ